MGTNYLTKMLLLGAVVMGSMVIGLTSCSSDEEKGQSPQPSTEVEKELEEKTEAVAVLSTQVVEKTNELAQKEVELANKGSVSEEENAELEHLKNELALLKSQLSVKTEQLNTYVVYITNNTTTTVNKELLNRAKETQEGGAKVVENASTLVESTENYLSNPTAENLQKMGETAKTCIVYRVAFDSQGGSKVDTAFVKSGDKVVKPTDPTWDNHTFLGWYVVKNGVDTTNKQFDFNSVITKDITLYAFWKEGSSPTPTPVPEKTYNVIFDAQNGSATTTTKVKEGSTVTKPTDPTLNGYSFFAWYGKQDTVGMSSWNFSSDKITQDTTLYGFWRNPGTGENNPHCDREGTQGEGGWF